MRKRAMGLEFIMRKRDSVRVPYDKNSDGVKVASEKKSDGLRVHQKKERWGESSL